MRSHYARKASILKTVLFAWELGAGAGHLMNLRRLAACLLPHGVRVIAGISNTAAAAALDGVFSEIHQVPSWPGTSLNKQERSAHSSATMNDILVGAGLANTVATTSMLEAWDKLLRTTRPDLVIAEYAPAAVLAAQCRVPLMLFGSGFTLPPESMHRFPLLHRTAPPVFSEEETLAAVNAAKAAFKWPLLDRLPQIFSGDASFVGTFALLDPYRNERITPAIGPILDRSPKPRKASAETIFVYISRGETLHRDLVSALRPFANRVHIHAPMLSVGQCKELGARGATVAVEPVPLADALADCCLVVHLGGIGVAAEALAAGVPQLILSTHIEQELNGLALEHAGVGRLIRAHDPASTISSDAIETIFASGAMAMRAAELGGAVRAILKEHCPRTKFTDLALKVIG
jgi:UDP:flavonoid glycosyltransferase YjiC (YdhE family)